jgi:hypothetical protein
LNAAPVSPCCSMGFTDRHGLHNHRHGLHNHRPWAASPSLSAGPERSI